MPPRPMTSDTLMLAFAGEPMAHVRYHVFTKIAEKEGFPQCSPRIQGSNIRRLHTRRNHYWRLRNLKEDAKVTSRVPFGPGNTGKNLELPIIGEESEVENVLNIYRNSENRGRHGR